MNKEEMNKEEMTKKLYSDVAYFCKLAIEIPSSQNAYQNKAAGIIHARETIGVITIQEFSHMVSMVWDGRHLSKLFNYANEKGGHLFEI